MNTVIAIKDPRTKDFMEKLKDLCLFHNMVVVPTYNGSVSFHDTMVVTNFGKESQEFLDRTEIEEGQR